MNNTYWKLVALVMVSALIFAVACMSFLLSGNPVGIPVMTLAVAVITLCVMKM